MNILKFVLSVFIIAFISACASPGPKVLSSVDPNANLGSFKTFGFMPELGTDRPGGIRTPLSNMLINAVSKELESRGIRQADSPDMLLNFFVSVDQRLDIYRIPSTRRYHGYRYTRYRTWGGYKTLVREYNQGTLSIDLVDPQRKMLVWEGIAQGRLRSDTIKLTQERVDEFVSAIMAEFPKQ